MSSWPGAALPPKSAVSFPPAATRCWDGWRLRMILGVWGHVEADMNMAAGDSRVRVFPSYSRKDADFVIWLSSALESREITGSR